MALAIAHQSSFYPIDSEGMNRIEELTLGLSSVKGLNRVSNESARICLDLVYFFSGVIELAHTTAWSVSSLSFSDFFPPAAFFAFAAPFPPAATLLF